MLTGLAVTAAWPVGLCLDPVIGSSIAPYRCEKAANHWRGDDRGCLQATRFPAGTYRFAGCHASLMPSPGCSYRTAIVHIGVQVAGRLFR